MPFAKTWTEELIAEWLELEGYLVVVGLPAGVAAAGGRYVADVAGAKVSDNSLEIMHVEVGQLSGGERSVKSVQRKFSNNVCKSIENYFKQSLGFKGAAVKYQKIYVASFSTAPTLDGAAKLGIIAWPLPNFIHQKIIPTICKWKEHPPQQPKTKGGVITLPESHWLLQLIDYFKKRGLLNEKQTEI